MRYATGHLVLTRRRILAAARRLFVDRGYAAASIGDVMAAAGLTRGGFYRHFRSKAELYALAVGPAAPAQLPHRVPHPSLDQRWSAWLDEQPLALLAADACSSSADVRVAARQRFMALVDEIRASVEGDSATAAEAHAQAVTALVVGALALAQALPDPLERNRLMADCQRAAQRLGDGLAGIDAGLFWVPLAMSPADRHA